METGTSCEAGDYTTGYCATQTHPVCKRKPGHQFLLTDRSLFWLHNNTGRSQEVTIHFGHWAVRDDFTITS